MLVNGTSIECLTTAHNPGSVAVTVTTASIGSALGTVMYEYIFEVTDISKCAGLDLIEVYDFIQVSDYSFYQ